MLIKDNKIKSQWKIKKNAFIIHKKEYIFKIR